MRLTFRLTLIVAALALSACGWGLCADKGRCPKDRDPHHSASRECERRTSGLCGSPFTAKLACEHDKEVCAADGSRDLSATGTAWAAESTAWSNCCSIHSFSC
jgi:hypothetical protein